MARTKTMTPERAANMVEQATIKGAKVTARVLAKVDKAQHVAEKMHAVLHSESLTAEKKLTKLERLLSQLFDKFSAVEPAQAKPCASGQCAD